MLRQYHDNLLQRSPEWYAIRRLRLTGSNATAIGNAGKGLETLVHELVMNEITEEDDFYDNHHMERGRELEPVARTVYEFETGRQIQDIGFVTLDDYAGCSPDGLVGSEGIVEVKCPARKAYFKFCLTGEIDSGYVWQIQMNLLVTGREWCDFIMYNPKFRKSLKWVRVFPDPKKQEALMNGIAKGGKMIEDLMKTVKEKGL